VASGGERIPGRVLDEILRWLLAVRPSAAPLVA
jgi:hypothetical protein